MRYNPCGAVVDIRRAPYKTQAVLFRDSDAQCTIEWYLALPTAKTLPFPSPISISDWDGEGYSFDGPHEVDGAPRTFTNWGSKIGFRGEHQCGDATDWAEGGHYDPLAPPVKYRSNHLPECCGNGVAAEIQLGTGPDAKVLVTNPDPFVSGAGIGLDAHVILYPPGEAPGGACGSAPFVPHTASVSAMWSVGSDQWWKFHIGAAGFYTITLTGATDTQVHVNGWNGVCPAGLLPLPLAHVAGSQTWTLFSLGSEDIWIEVIGVVGTGTYSLKLTP